MILTFAMRTLTALTLTCAFAAAAPKPVPAPATVKQTAVHRALNQAELKGLFSDQKAFANKLAKAMNSEAMVANPR